MIWKEFRLDSLISKVIEDITIWQTERGIIKISKNTLAIPIKFGDQQKGHVLHGQGKLLLDAIVETDEGAVGKSVEKELNEPFLMLGGGTKEMQKHLTKASEEDFSKMGYESPQGFVAKAEDLCNRFFSGRVHSDENFDEDHGLIFAFQNEDGELDLLVAKGYKLVYKAAGLVFVSNEDKVVLKSPGEVVVSDNGKSVIIKK